ncbi:unnamed protein product [Urochloa decumbens]|uniref:F-box domain-containing protein n=1 Tax=Urochloa decumbens TaxID=240449 RepID=A0ABC9ATQ1_9POAL
MGSNDSGAAATAGDRLSRLSDAVLGHVLSFLPADEAARAAVLSRQWRHVFAHVHTVALDEPDPHIPDYDGDWSPGYGGPVDRNAAAPSPPFTNAVSSALFRRLRGGGGAASVPLRALRVAFHKFSGLNAGLVDMWLWYAVQQAGKDGELHLDLQLRRSAAPCRRIYSLRRAGGAEEPPEAAMDDEDPASPRFELAVAADVDVALPATSPLSSDGDAADDEPPPPLYKNEYVVPWSLFTCAALRSLRIGPCRLDPPAVISLPSLDTLHLTGITGRRSAVQRLASACPRLADLTLESCNSNLTKLTVLDKRLRRLALRCCHGLAAVAVASSELRAFEYRGATPEPWFLTLHGGARRISSCAIDICGAEAAEPPELARLGAFLRLFPGVERLSLTSARLGGGAPAFPTFPKLRHLELTGMVPDDDTGAVATVTRILRRTPRLEALTLFFLPEVEELQEGDYQDIDEEELLDGHTLKYDRHAPLDVPEIDIPCLREGTKEINFVHYEGGLAQRKLAKFLLRNAPVVGEVCGEFAVGPLWIQTRLMEEIKEWVMNKSANMMFF